MPWEQRCARTHERFCDPQIGDRFTEMYSAWLHVIARNGPVVAVHYANADELKVYPSVEAFRHAESYQNIDGYPWVYVDNIGARVLDYLPQDAAPPAAEQHEMAAKAKWEVGR